MRGLSSRELPAPRGTARCSVPVADPALPLHRGAYRARSLERGLAWRPDHLHLQNHFKKRAFHTKAAKGVAAPPTHAVARCVISGRSWRAAPRILTARCLQTPRLSRHACLFDALEEVKSALGGHVKLSDVACVQDFGFRALLIDCVRDGSFCMQPVVLHEVL